MKKDIAPAKNVPPAFVLNWTSTRVEILCPFASCDQKVHVHGYSMPTESHLNTRRAHCYPSRQLDYRLLFPYEDDPLVRNFGFSLDRQNLKWISIADGLEDPRVDEMGELLSTLLVETRMAELRMAELRMAETRMAEPSHQYVLDGEDAELFLFACVNNDYHACKSKLETSKQLKTLAKGKDSRNGQTALSLVCEQGHLDIVKLLYEHGAELDSIDNSGQTPLMLATLNGHCQTASYLACLGASLFVKDNNGTTLIQSAKTAFQELCQSEWSRAKTPIYSTGMGSPDAMEQMENKNCALQILKERKEGLSQIIDLYWALKPERDIEKSVLTKCEVGDTFRIIQGNEAYRPQVSFSKIIFETHMAKESKAFAFLDLGRPFDHIQAAAVSGYTAGEVGNSDGCLNRNLWTSRVMKYCKVIGHEIQRSDQYGRRVPQEYHASHAEKQLMAYFLWMHTTVDWSFEDSNDNGEVWGSCYEIDKLQTCKPNVASMKKDIYVSREPCPDCKLFQQRLYEKAGILFNFFFIKPIIA